MNDWLIHDFMKRKQKNLSLLIAAKNILKILGRRKVSTRLPGELEAYGDLVDAVEAIKP